MADKKEYIVALVATTLTSNGLKPIIDVDIEDEIFAKFSNEHRGMANIKCIPGTFTNKETIIHITVVIFYQEYTEEQAIEKNCIEMPCGVNISKVLSDEINKCNVDLTGFNINF